MSSADGLGARLLHDGSCSFSVWAPEAERLELRLLDPEPRLVPMERRERGYWVTRVVGVEPGARYLYRLDGDKERADPASSSQPEGVHGPSRVVDHRSFSWDDTGWRGRELEELVLYELHVGTFTPEGTFDAVLPRLDELAKLGITALEIMPVAQFPGSRNWGYDGVYPFAVQQSYGGPEGLRRLVNAAHAAGLAVVLDVVYNHLGPEGNYLRDFGPYFSDRYRSPWGEAVNFDGPESDEVRRFFIENALHWFRDFHVDALRLDAVHAIYDFSARPFLGELAERVAAWRQESGQMALLIAESDLNDSRLIRRPAEGGIGLDAQWSDDFHHALHTLLTGEDRGYYVDYGSLDQLATALREAFVYRGEYSAFRRRRHGNSTRGCPARRFVVCAQNHDQVGNRREGERLVTLVGQDAGRLAATLLLCSPWLPLLFMGEEYGERAPFLYFVSFEDEGLIEAVRRGRQEEFSAFEWESEPPDPQSPETFRRSRLDWDLASRGEHGKLRDYYRELLRLRRAHPALRAPERESVETGTLPASKVLWFQRGSTTKALVVANFSRRSVAVPCPGSAPSWRKLLDSADTRWGGAGAAVSERLAPGALLELAPLSAVLLSTE